MVDPLVAAVLTVCMVVLLRIVGPVPLWGCSSGSPDTAHGGGCRTVQPALLPGGRHAE